MKAASLKWVETVLILTAIIILLVPQARQKLNQADPFQYVDQQGLEYVEASFDRALVAFALARGTNAIISVIQDSEIDIAPAGVGVTIAIGEALDPLNDMIERFSWVMLVSLVSLGIQRFLVEISPWISMQFLLLPALFLLLLSLWGRAPFARMAAGWGARLILLALVVRFCVPVVAMVNNQAYTLFLDQHYAAAINNLEQGNEVLKQVDPLGDLSGEQSTGLWSEMKKRAAQAAALADIRAKVDGVKARLVGMVEDLLQMIAVFLLSTIILPLGFLWLLLRMFRALVGGHHLVEIESLLVSRITGSEAVHPGRNLHDLKVDEENENVKENH